MSGKRKANAIVVSDDEKDLNKSKPLKQGLSETILSSRGLWLEAVTCAVSQYLESLKPLGQIVAIYAILYKPEFCQKCAKQLMYFGGHCRECGSAAQSKLHVGVWDSIKVSDEEFKKWQATWPRVIPYANAQQQSMVIARQNDLRGLGTMLTECKKFNRFLTDHQLRAVFKHAVPEPDGTRSTDSAKAVVTLMCFGFLIANTDPCWNGDIVEGCTALRVTQALTEQYKAMNHHELKLFILQGGPMALVKRQASASSASASASAL
jgi:hypothetical protein